MDTAKKVNRLWFITVFVVPLASLIILLLPESFLGGGLISVFGKGVKCHSAVVLSQTLSFLGLVIIWLRAFVSTRLP